MTQISQTQPPPQPGANTASEALNLLTALGGGEKNTREFLAECVRVQKHNEKVHEAAKGALAELQEAQKQLDKRQAGIVKLEELAHEALGKAKGRDRGLDSRDAWLKARGEVLDEREEALKAADAKLDADRKSENGRVSGHTSRLNEREKKLEARENHCTQREQRIQHAAQVIQAARASVSNIATI